MEKVLGGGAWRCGLRAVACTGLFGECVRDGGEEIGESCVLGGGVLPRKGRRPLDGALRGLGGKSGLEGRGLLLCGGAIVSLRGSGVSGRASMDGNNLGDDSSGSSSSSPCSSL